MVRVTLTNHRRLTPELLMSGIRALISVKVNPLVRSCFPSGPLGQVPRGNHADAVAVSIVPYYADQASGKK